jgi:hypothetical protein
MRPAHSEVFNAHVTRFFACSRSRHCLRHERGYAHNNLWIGSNTKASDQLQVYKLHLDGTPDLTFGTDGAACADTLPSGYDYTNDIHIDAQGRVVLAGFGNAGAQSNDAALARFWP